MRKYLIVNSFPRSGSVYFSNILKEFQPESYFTDTACLHIPYFIGVDRTYTAVLLRNPFDSICSALTMIYDSRDDSLEDNHIQDLISLYSEFLDILEKSTDLYNVCIVDFDKFITNSILTVKKYLDKYKIKYKIPNQSDKELFNKYQIILNSFENFTDLKRLGNMPRKLDNDREYIFWTLKDNEEIKLLYNRYLKLLPHCI